MIHNACKIDVDSDIKGHLYCDENVINAAKEIHYAQYVEVLKRKRILLLKQ